MDWVDEADRFWAGELGVAPGVLRTDGFRVFERAGADARHRATVVGTSSATIVSLPEGRAPAFENAGLRLEEMTRSPRRYLTSCHSLHSLEVRGPAYLGYWPPSAHRPRPQGLTEVLDGDGLARLAFLRDTAPAEWEEAGIGPDSRVLGLRVEGQIVAVAGYEPWAGHIAQLQVFCHPSYRRRGLAAESIKAAISSPSGRSPAAPVSGARCQCAESRAGQTGRVCRVWVDGYGSLAGRGQRVPKGTTGGGVGS